MRNKFNKSLLTCGVVAAMCAGAAFASSHREAPYIGKYPQLDGTDFYMFKSYEPGREDYVTILANYNPVQAAYGGPNYFPLDSAGLYEIHIDNDGDAEEDLTFQFRFSNEEVSGGTVKLPVGSGENQKMISASLKNVGELSAADETGLNQIESYTMTRVDGDRRRGNKRKVVDANSGQDSFRKPFDYSGTKTFGGPGQYTAYADSFVHDTQIPGCDAPGRVFVGQRSEGFKIALGEVFDLVNFVPIEGDSAPGAGDGGGFNGGVTQDENRNILAKNNVTTIAIEVHKDCLTGDGNGVIGGWTTSSLRQATILNRRPTLARPEIGLGGWTQVSRLGNFLVNELVIGFPDKDRFNSSEPNGDGRFLDYVTHPVLPEIIDSLFNGPVNATLGTSIDNLAPSNVPRQDLVTGFLTGFPGVNQLATVTPSEMLRLNTNFDAVPREAQHPLGVAAGDVAGFPNGRRPGDDAVDIALRVVMGALCHDVPLGEGGALINLGLCAPEDAPVGGAALTDGAPISAKDFDNTFPYLLTPYPGSPNDAPIPTPKN
ncbi:MAG: DUF4331 domain-containing protein [Aliiglaciecola sp.]